MISVRKIMFPLLIAIIAMHFSFEDSEARRRIGGGRSFGSKPNMTRERTMPNNQNQMNRQNVQQGGTGQQANRGFLGGMGGMLTGLLAGTFLGSLLSGSGFGSGGFMGIILVGILLFVGMRLFKTMSASKRREQYRPATEVNGTKASYQDSAWAMLDGEKDKEVENETKLFPADFNEAEFSKGAKILFSRLQESWAKNDLVDIKKFTSAEVFTEIENQSKEDPTLGEVAVLHVDAQVLEVKDSDGERQVLVFFNALLQESKEAETTDVNEYWHFVRSEKSNGMWILEGIQQSR